MDRDLLEHQMAVVMGQLHALGGFLQAMAIEHPNPRQLAISAAKIAQVGLAKIESQAVPDGAIDGYQWMMSELRKAIPAGPA
jgi:hypothetical protein